MKIMTAQGVDWTICLSMLDYVSEDYEALSFLLHEADALRYRMAVQLDRISKKTVLTGGK